MNADSANRRDILRAGALFGVALLLPDSELFRFADTGTIVSVGTCKFPRPIPAEEYLQIASRWQNVDETRQLLSEFRSAGLILNENIELGSQSAVWTLEFRDLEAFKHCHARFSERFDEQALKRDGFKREMKVTSTGTGETLVFIDS